VPDRGVTLWLRYEAGGAAPLSLRGDCALAIEGADLRATGVVEACPLTATFGVRGVRVMPLAGPAPALS
jgi:hypothetical protein